MTRPPRPASSNLVAVFDTNVIVPLILPNSTSQRLLTAIHESGGEAAVSPQILDEVARVLRTKPRLRQWLNVSDERVEAFLTTLPSLFRQIRGGRQVHGIITRDPHDDKILAAALEAGAVYVVTEDRHLLDLKHWRGIQLARRRNCTTIYATRRQPRDGRGGRNGTSQNIYLRTISEDSCSSAVPGSARELCGTLLRRGGLL